MSEAAVAITNASSNHNEKQRGERAALEGEDADIRPDDQEPSHGEKQKVAREDRETANAAIAGGSSSPKNSDSGEKIGDEEAGKTSSGYTESGNDHNAQDAEPPDPNIVGWDGPEDPHNPVNWKSGLKWSNVGTVSAITFIT